MGSRRRPILLGNQQGKLRYEPGLRLQDGTHHCFTVKRTGSPMGLTLLPASHSHEQKWCHVLEEIQTLGGCLHCPGHTHFLDPSEATAGMWGAHQDWLHSFDSELHKIQTRPLQYGETATCSLGLKKFSMKSLIYCKRINPVIL